MKSRITTSYDPKIDPKEVAAIRRKFHLSQDQFAKMLHINVHTLRNWEQGIYTPTPYAILLLRLLYNHPELLEEIDDVLNHPIM